jgi:hypothetical protein
MVARLYSIGRKMSRYTGQGQSENPSAIIVYGFRVAVRERDSKGMSFGLGYLDRVLDKLRVVACWASESIRLRALSWSVNSAIRLSCS